MLTLRGMWAGEGDSDRAGCAAGGLCSGARLRKLLDYDPESNRLCHNSVQLYHVDCLALISPCARLATRCPLY
eukprot:2141516-Rhodomonas_salina.3